MLRHVQDCRRGPLHAQAPKQSRPVPSNCAVHVRCRGPSRGPHASRRGGADGAPGSSPCRASCSPGGGVSGARPPAGLYGVLGGMRRRTASTSCRMASVSRWSTMGDPLIGVRRRAMLGRCDRREWASGEGHCSRRQAASFFPNRRRCRRPASSGAAGAATGWFPRRLRRAGSLSGRLGRLITPQAVDSIGQPCPDVVIQLDDENALCGR